MKSSVLLLCLLGAGVLAHASILPPNHLQREDSLLSLSSMDEDAFNALIDQTVDQYKPLAEKFGGRLSAEKRWEDPTVNAGAKQDGKKWIVRFFGGLARRPEISKDSFQLSICHELGHHFGGYPFYEGGPGWNSNEGESDYFAAQVCARQLWKDDTKTNRTFRDNVEPAAKAFCDKAWKSDADQDLCYRITKASMELAILLNKTGRDPDPQFNTPDKKRVSHTSDSHPAGQCRLDTFVSASICTATNPLDVIAGKEVSEGFNSAEAETEAAKYSCFVKSGFKIGLRPRCWFAPQNETYRAWGPRIRED